MINDIMNNPVELKIDEKVYKLEYDNSSYAVLEHCVGKNLFYIYDALVINNTLSFMDFAEIAACALLKHHAGDEVEEFKKKLLDKPSLMVENHELISLVFATALIPYSILKKLSVGKVSKKKTKTGKKK